MTIEQNIIMTEIYQTLTDMRARGWGHTDLIERALALRGKGYDLSYDRTLMLLHFGEGYIVINRGQVDVFSFK